jgi:hypothetical protein
MSGDGHTGRPDREVDPGAYGRAALPDDNGGHVRNATILGGVLSAALAHAIRLTDLLRLHGA